MLIRLRPKTVPSRSPPAGTSSVAVKLSPATRAEASTTFSNAGSRDEHESQRHEDFLRGVHGEPGHLGVRRRRRGDVLDVRSKVRARRRKHGERAGRGNGVFFPFRKRRGAVSRDATATKRADDSHRCACPRFALPTLVPSRRDRELTLAPSPVSSYPTGSRSIHSANAVVAKHERVAFSADARPMCDICQVRGTTNRRKTHAARRRAARGGVAWSRARPRGRRRVAPTPDLKRVETTFAVSVTETPHGSGHFQRKRELGFGACFSLRKTRHATRSFPRRDPFARLTEPRVFLPPLQPPTANEPGCARVGGVPRGPRVPVPRVRHVHPQRQRVRGEAPALLFTGVGLALESTGSKPAHGSKQQTQANNVAPTNVMENSNARSNAAPKPSKGKRKAAAMQQNSHESEDALVPLFAGPSSSVGAARRRRRCRRRVQLVRGGLRQGGAAADADFLDTSSTTSRRDSGMRISASCRRSGDLTVGGEIRESRLRGDARGNVGDIGVERELRGWDGWVHA